MKVNMPAAYVRDYTIKPVRVLIETTKGPSLKQRYRLNFRGEFVKEFTHKRDVTTFIKETYLVETRL
jgi:hypothetical protein